jgi:hypothetical protein
MTSSFGRIEATFLPVRPDWLVFDCSECAESIQDVIVSHSKLIAGLGVTKNFENFYLRLHIGFAVLVSWCRSNWSKIQEVGTKSPHKLGESTNSGRVIWNTFQALKIHCTWCTWCERRLWNSLSRIFRFDQIWRGHEIGSFDPVIKNSSATNSRWPQIYVCTHSNAAYLFHKACSERTLVVYGQMNMRYERTCENIYWYGYEVMRERMVIWTRPGRFTPILGDNDLAYGSR